MFGLGFRVLWFKVGAVWLQRRMAPFVGIRVVVSLTRSRSDIKVANGGPTSILSP